MHKFNPSIFREYDIRGTYADNLTDADAYQIGLNYATTLKKGIIAIGYDGRLSSPALFEALANGITDGRAVRRQLPAMVECGAIA